MAKLVQFEHQHAAGMEPETGLVNDVNSMVGGGGELEISLKNLTQLLQQRVLWLRLKKTSEQLHTPSRQQNAIKAITPMVLKLFAPAGLFLGTNKKPAADPLMITAQINYVYQANMCYQIYLLESRQLFVPELSAHSCIALKCKWKTLCIA